MCDGQTHDTRTNGMCLTTAYTPGVYCVEHRHTKTTEILHPMPTTVSVSNAKDAPIHAHHGVC